MEIGTEAALFPEKEYISGIFFAVCSQRDTRRTLKARKVHVGNNYMYSGVHWPEIYLNTAEAEQFVIRKLAIRRALRSLITAGEMWTREGNHFPPSFPQCSGGGGGFQPWIPHSTSSKQLFPPLCGGGPLSLVLNPSITPSTPPPFIPPSPPLPPPPSSPPHNLLHFQQSMRYRQCTIMYRRRIDSIAEHTYCTSMVYDYIPPSRWWYRRQSTTYVQY